MRTGATILMLAATLSLGGCIIAINDDAESGWNIGDWKDSEHRNREAIARLNVGDSRTDVMSRLGEPAFTEGFTSNGQDYQVFYFRTHRERSDGKTTKGETTPVVFADDHLIGWGQKALDQAMLATE